MENLLHLIRRIRRGPLRRFAYKKYFNYRLFTAGKRCLPDFLIIGTERGGSTSMFEMLDQHPQLSASFWKEIDYFTGGFHKEDDYQKGELWYRAHFPLKRDMRAGNMTFEGTPRYLFHAAAPERIFNLLPNVKMIALLRNPSERAISHYFMSRRKNHEPLPMLEALQRDEQELLAQPLADPRYKQDYRFQRDSYKGRGLYYEQLKRYLQFFSREQILLLKSEDFFSDVGKTLQTVFEFLGVDSGFRIPDAAPRNTGKEKGEVPAQVRKYLDDFYRPHNQALYELTGIDFGG